MPGISGLDVLRLVGEAGLSPVIWMFTGEEDLDIAIKTLNMGASGYLTKPFEIKKIRDIVLNTMMSRGHKEQGDTRDDKPWHVKKQKQP